MKDLIYHIFPTKAIQIQKRYLRRELYKPCGTNIRYFIYHICDMVEYLKKFPPFGAGQLLPEDDILELVEFSLPKECQKELTIQGFDSVTQSLVELVEFCERLKTTEEIFLMQDEGNHQNKKTISLMNATNQSSRRRAKGPTRPRTPRKRTLTKIKPK